MKYLGIECKRPRIAVFDLTGCQGCELQLANREETLAAFLGAIEIVSFREISSAHSDDYAIALVDGAVSRDDEVARLEQIRARAEVLVAIGSCACFGGVNRLKNAFSLADANREVYGDQPQATLPVRAVKEVVPVDLEIPGCPVSKAEVERIVQHLIWDVPYHFPAYPVCLECKQRYTVCCYELGRLCLGPVTRAGCNAPCPAAGVGCWGCRGPAADANLDELLAQARQRGHGEAEISERLAFFGGFEGS
jgi:coenzyme F420-reducing hydrogenase gamma subunit